MGNTLKSHCSYSVLSEMVKQKMFERAYTDGSDFVREVAEEYVESLVANSADIPHKAREEILSDIESDVRSIFLKTVSGCFGRLENL